MAIEAHTFGASGQNASYWNTFYFQVAFLATCLKIKQPNYISPVVTFLSDPFDDIFRVNLLVCLSPFRYVTAAYTNKDIRFEVGAEFVETMHTLVHV